MEVFSLVGKLRLDGAEQANEQLKQTGINAEQVSKGLKIAGAAFTAVGVAGLAMVSSARNLNAELGQTAITVGVSTKEMRNLALSVTDVTFPLKSVTATFELLARAGMRNTKEMKIAALAFDTLADATKSSAEAVAATLIPAFRALGINITETGDHIDKLTWLTMNTTMTLEGFGSVMSYVATYGQDLNLTIDDMIGIMAALNARGLESSEMTRLFRTAVSGANGSTTKFLRTLGLTKEGLQEYIPTAEEVVGLANRMKAAGDEQYTIMDKLKSQWEKLTLSAGNFLTPLEPILAALTALGPIMIFFSTSMGIAAYNTVIHTGALIAHKIALIAHAVATGISTAALWAWNIALTVATGGINLLIPIIIAGIAALIGIGVLLWKNWDTVKEGAIKTWDTIKGTIVKAINFIIDKINAFIDILNKIPLVNIGKLGTVGGTVSSFGKGGIVPGRIGEPTLAMVHGGETIGRGFTMPGGYGGMGSQIVNVYIGGSVVTERDLQRSIREAFIDIRNRNTSTGF